MTSSRNARVCAFSRIGPITLRIAVVVPDKPTRNTYFSQISRRMLVESSALMPPFRQASRSASARVDLEYTVLERDQRRARSDHRLDLFEDRLGVPQLDRQQHEVRHAEISGIV